ncbi:MAG: hypothetical protein SEPTF4163_004974 [Sporothrix epigloea]
MLRWIAETETNQRATAGAQKKRTRCPACNARIRTIEPHDRIVALGDRITRLQRRAAPPMLATMLASMGIAASASYGYQALLMVAGEPVTSQWLFPSIITDATGKAAKVVANSITEGAGQGVAAATVRLSAYEMWSYHFVFVQKLTALSLVAPGLLLHRAVPSLANFLALPVSAIYGAALLWRNRGHLSSLTLRRLWPPSPSWALVAMPLVSIAYTTAYNDLFGGLERRLNLALRGRPIDEPEEGAEVQQVPQVEVQAGQDEVAPVQGQQLPRPDVAPGFLASLLRLGVAALQLIGNDDDHEHEHEDEDHNDLDQIGAPAAEIDAGRPGNAVAIELGLGINLVVEEIDERAERHEAEVAVAAADDGNGDEDDWVDEADDEEIQPRPRARDENVHIFGGHGGGVMWDMPFDAIPPPGHRVGPHGIVEIAHHAEPPQRAQAQWLELQAQPPRAPPAPPAPRNGGAGIIFTEIVTAITSRLLLPRMAASAGELLEAFLPKSWVMLPPVPVLATPISIVSDSDAVPTLVEAAAVVPRRGLLQERWGRSLVGGLLLIVLRDAWRLLLKYRRAQMKQQRQIRNVERRRNKKTTTTTSATNEAP